MRNNKDEKKLIERWHRMVGPTEMPAKHPGGAPLANKNRLKHGIFSDRILSPEEKSAFDDIIERLCSDFQFNRSSDFLGVELIGIYSVKLSRALTAGDADAAEKFDRMLRAHMRDLKTTKISREGEQPTGPTTSPAEWAAALIDKVAGKIPEKKPLLQKNAEIITDNTEEADFEEAEPSGVTDD